MRPSSLLQCWLLVGCWAGSLAIGGCSGCQRDEAPSKPAKEASDGGVELTAEQRSQVLARVGGRVITLGEYEAVLRRMDRFERLRYQSADRRMDLLKEMVDVELLAGEAERRGLDKRPKTQQRIQQALRDEVLRRVRAEVPDAAAIPEGEVRDYYDRHREEFYEPERRRVAHIVMRSRPQALKVLEEARGASPEQWGRLVRQYSLEKAPAGRGIPPELAGDLGIVSRPGDPGSAPQVPAAIREAVFTIDEPGGVSDQLVSADGKFHIVRMTSRTSARQRSYQEAERAVRVSMVRRKVEEAEKKLEAELRRRYPVTIDEQALKKLEASVDSVR